MKCIQLEILFQNYLNGKRLIRLTSRPVSTTSIRSGTSTELNVFKLIRTLLIPSATIKTLPIHHRKTNKPNWNNMFDSKTNSTHWHRRIWKRYDIYRLFYLLTHKKDSDVFTIKAIYFEFSIELTLNLSPFLKHCYQWKSNQIL